MIPVEIGVDDVFVFLWRILGETDRSIRPKAKPLGMLLQPGMVERALHRKVEGDIHLVLAADGDEPAKIIERAQLRFDRVMTAIFVADRVEAARILWTGIERIVFALPVRAPNRMDRRQIKNVEAKPRDFRHARHTIVECAVAAGSRALAPWHHFVPGACTRALAFSQYWNYLTTCEIRPRLGLCHGRGERIVEEQVEIAFGHESPGKVIDGRSRLAVLGPQLRQQP